VPGDAIGNDIVGQYKFLQKLRLKPTIVCEYPHASIVAEYNVSNDLSPESISQAFDVLIYHHSVEWLHGEAIINGFRGPVVAKYHCVTPARFFRDYSASDEESCRRGAEQTGRLAANARIALWTSDSQHNAREIEALGVSANRSFVIPPFNRTARLVKLQPKVSKLAGESIKLLFVGRRVPHKGHKHLISVVAAYQQIIARPIRCRVVGAADENMKQYSSDLANLAKSLGVEESLEWIPHITDDALEELFLESSVYVNLSEHEGFCVPIIEAQAIGVPVVTTNCGATGETAGANQIVLGPISELRNYDTIAGLIEEIDKNEELRMFLIEEGFRNYYERFTDDRIETALTAALIPLLN
jgi:glycosyltransferase involved in cell wall biosynthesis